MTLHDTQQKHGLIVRGRIAAVENVIRKADNAPIDGFKKVRVVTDRSELTVDLARVIRSPYGDQPNQAWDKLQNAAGQTYEIEVVLVRNNNGYTNLAAIDADQVA